MDGTRDTPLVGRADDLDRLLSIVAASPAVVTLAGEAGIGKTRLVAELAADPKLGGRRVLVGGCRWIREPFPLGPFVEVLRGLRDALAAARLSPVVGALRPLLPELTDVLPTAPKPPDDRATQRHQVFRALVEVLTAVGPAVVVVEDLHWADKQTVEFLSYLVSTLPADLSLVLTFRDAEVAPRVRAVAARPPLGVGRAEIVLAPLDTAATGALAAAVLATDSVTEEFAAHLCQRASGLPLAVMELVALLRARGTLVRHSNGWARRLLDELDVPVGIRDPVLERVTRLDSRAQVVVTAAAVLETAPVPLLLTVAGIGEADGVHGLTEALDSGLLVERGAEVGFRHVLAAQAVYGNVTGPRRREIHGRAADTLRAAGTADTGRIAHHLRQAGRLADWVPAAETAADQAVALGNDDEAVRLLAEVMRDAPLDLERRHRVVVKLARASLDAATGAHNVAELLAAALTPDLPPPVRGELRFTLAVLYDKVADPRLQRQLLLDALPDLDGRPDLKAWAMVGLGVPRTRTATAAEHRTWLHRALAIVPRLENTMFQLFLLGKIGMILTPLGDPHWRHLTDRMGQLTGATVRHHREVRAYLSVGAEACSCGHHAAATQLLARAHEGAAACGHPSLDRRVRASFVLLDWYRGHWDGLRERVAALFAESGPGFDADADVDIGAVAGCLALAHGDHDIAGAMLDDALTEMERQHEYGCLALPIAASARLAVARGEPHTFLAHVDRFTAVWEATGVWASAMRSLPAVAEVLVAAGQTARAHDLTTLFAERAGGLDAPLAPAALHHTRGFLTAADQRWSQAATHFQAAAEQYIALQCPYEAAQVQEEAASCWFALGHPDAEHSLAAAIAAYQTLGARSDLERAASLARRHGVSPPAPHRGGSRGYGSELSPREQEVARLAATGRTNREIADALYLSPKTVDKHISAALRKLGLRTRTGLAHHTLAHHDAAGSRPGSRNGEFSP